MHELERLLQDAADLWLAVWIVASVYRRRQTNRRLRGYR